MGKEEIAHYKQFFFSYNVFYSIRKFYPHLSIFLTYFHLLLNWKSLKLSNFLSGVFSPLTSAEACRKSSRWLWKESCVRTGVRKPGKHTCVTNCHDMTSAVKVALNPNTTNQSTVFAPSRLTVLEFVGLKFSTWLDSQ